jgi:uncharacterized Fe-S cluster protein YjdI
MARRIQEYRSEAISVTFDPNRCIHAARCVQGLPGVFDVGERRWVRPENATADEIAEVIHRCPSGALQYERLDGGPAEAPDETPIIFPSRNGPYYVRGAVELLYNDEILPVINRAALCRCGQSENKPFCDNTHRRIGFEAE